MSSGKEQSTRVTFVEHRARALSFRALYQLIKSIRAGSLEQSADGTGITAWWSDGPSNPSSAAVAIPDYFPHAHGDGLPTPRPKVHGVGSTTYSSPSVGGSGCTWPPQTRALDPQLPRAPVIPPLRYVQVSAAPPPLCLRRLVAGCQIAALFSHEVAQRHQLHCSTTSLCLRRPCNPRSSLPLSWPPGPARLTPNSCAVSL